MAWAGQTQDTSRRDLDHLTTDAHDLTPVAVSLPLGEDDGKSE